MSAKKYPPKTRSVASGKVYPAKYKPTQPSSRVTKPSASKNG